MSESTMIISKENTRRWENEAGQLHREDGPAIETADGIKVWYQRGKRHRIDGPAVLYPDYEIWYHNGYYLGSGLDGFWALWDRLDEKQRQNVNLHMWLRKLTND